MDTKEAYRKKLNAQIEEWNAQINLLSAKIKNKGADVNLSAATQLEKLKKNKDQSQKQEIRFTASSSRA